MDNFDLHPNTFDSINTFEPPCSHIPVWGKLNSKRFGKSFIKDSMKVDIEDAYLFDGKRCSLAKGYASFNTYDDVLGKYTRILCSRYIMDPPDNLEVDHINGDILDNRKCNLRIVSHKKNMENRQGPNKNNIKSGIRGVTLRPEKENRSKPWVAKVTHNWKRIIVGYFKTKEEAEQAVIKKRKELNFLTGENLND